MSKYLMIKFLILIVLVGTSLLVPIAAFASSGHHHPHGLPPNGQQCQPAWEYDNLSRQANQLAQIGPTYRDYNGTNSPATATFSASQSGSVSVTASGGGTFDLSAIVAGVQVNLGLSVSYTLTASLGDSISITVPPYRAGYGAYGVWRVVTFGHFYHVSQYCKIDQDEGTVEGWSPYYIGWNTWIGS